MAYGATIQAGILSGQKVDHDILLLDVTPLSLGIACHDELKEKVIMKAIIKRNTPIPVSKTEKFFTSCDNQKKVDIHVLQGDAENY